VDLQLPMQSVHITTNVVSSTSLMVRRCRASKRNFARQNKTALGTWGQTETSLNIEDFS
jgi:hypothetical protein